MIFSVFGEPFFQYFRRNLLMYHWNIVMVFRRSETAAFDENELNNGLREILKTVFFLVAIDPNVFQCLIHFIQFFFQNQWRYIENMIVMLFI